MSGPEQQTEQSDRGRFAERLQWLVDTVHPADREKYTDTEIAAGTADHPGAMSRVFVRHLLDGRQKYPRMHHIQALSDFFGVKPEYFFDDDVAAETRRQIEEVVAWRDDEATALARRISALPDSARTAVSTMVDTLASYEDKPRDQRKRRKRDGLTEES